MGGGFVIFLIIFLVIRTMKNIEKNNRKKTAGQQPPAAEQPAPVPQKKADPRFPEYYEETPAVPSKPRAMPQADPRFPPADISGKPRPVAPVSAAPFSQEGRAGGEGTTSMPRKRAVQTVNTRLETPVGRRHALEASQVTGHAHTESSMSGFVEDCPPVVVPAAGGNRQSEQQTALPKLQFDQNSLVSGLLYGEILGKPKALRR